jgi:hypothetical protein
MREPRFRQANCCAELSDILPGVAPNNLTDTDNDHDSAIERPMLVPLHEAAAHCTPGKIESLQEPNASHQDHQDTNEAAENPHDSIEHSHQNVPPFLFFAFSERTRVCLSAEFAGIQFIPRILVDERWNCFNTETTCFKKAPSSWRAPRLEPPARASTCPEAASVELIP